MPIFIDSIEIKPKTIDMSLSGLGNFEGNALWINEVELVNAIELLRLEGRCFQTQLCSCCGIEGCEPGSWAAFRTFGEFVFLVPAIEAMSEGSWEKDEYAPPSFLRKYGVPAFTKKQYDNLVRKHSKFPLSKNIPALNNAELLSVLQIEAPGHVLGKVAEPVSLNSEPIIAVQEGVLDVEMAKFELLLKSLKLQEEALYASEDLPKVKFVLDLPGFPEWAPMAYLDGVGLLLAENKTMEVRWPRPK